MSDIIGRIPFITVDGPRKEHDVTVYALSTCGFCSRALEFLDQHGVAYRYVHLDTLDPEMKDQVKQTLKETYGERVTYPYTVVNRKEVLKGFIEPNWRMTLDIG